MSDDPLTPEQRRALIRSVQYMESIIIVDQVEEYLKKLMKRTPFSKYTDLEWRILDAYYS